MLTTRDAAARLGLTPQSVARLCKNKQIEATKHGRDYLISEAELARFAALDRPAHRPTRKENRMKYFIYDANGYVGEGYVSETDVATPPQRAALIEGLTDGLLRLIYTNDGGDSYANDYDQDGQPVER